jgi:hypothetical protein
MQAPLLKALDDPRLLGSLPWWESQRRLLASLEEPVVTHAWNCSRQTGKSSMVAAVSVWNCCCRDDLDAIVDNRRRHVLVISTNTEQSQNFLEIAAEFARRSPVISRWARIKQDHIEFKLPSGAKPVIVAMPARDAAARGRTASLVCLDEFGHLSGVEGPANDERLFAALTPSVTRFGDLARNVCRVAAHAKLTGRREARFLELVGLGLTTTEASRAVGVSRMTVHRHRVHDPVFAACLEAARIRPEPAPALPSDVDWQAAAQALERFAPERWAPLPDLPDWHDE